MLATPGRPENTFGLIMNPRYAIVPLLLAAAAGVASARQITNSGCAVGPTATYPATPDAYPMTSDQYAVQYMLGGEAGWTDARVYISKYGDTDASPYRSDSGYTVGETSMSFVSIPAGSGANVQLRVTLLAGPPTPAPIPFLRSDSVSVRPSVKRVDTELMSDGTVQISTSTGENFAGEQFILWWDRGKTQGGGIQGLAFFLDPIYKAPTGPNVRVIATPTDLAGDLSPYDTLDLEDNTTASNVFVRSGDDSLMMWGSNITVTNATVWQNYNGGVVNLGWSNNSTGNNCLIDGLYVVKTDWFTPTAPSFSMTGPNFTLNDQNNAVIASLMVPGTMFGMSQPSLYENIYVEDPPQVLLSLKILPPDCDLVTFEGAGCPLPVDLTRKSVLNLNIDKLFTPPPIEENSIGFQTLLNYPNSGPVLPSVYILTGSMNIQLTNVIFLGTVVTNGDDASVDYCFAPGALFGGLVPSDPVANSASFPNGVPRACHQPAGHD